MRRMRQLSAAHSEPFYRLFSLLEVALHRARPMLRRVGYPRLERPFAALERSLKGFLFDCGMCGQCVLSSTGMSCPVNCPKQLRNGPCGGIGADLFIGAVENPFVPPYALRALRIARKAAAGARFIQTQYCFDVPLLERFLARYREEKLTDRCFLLVGVGLLPSAQTARWIRTHVPGVHIPGAIVERLERAQDTRGR